MPEEIDTTTPTEQPLEVDEGLNEEEERLLESHQKRYQINEPAKFQTLYGLVGFMAVFAISYLFHTVLDLDCTVPLNLGIYVVSGVITCYFLSESYLTMYETESTRALSDDNGKWIKDLESRMSRRADSIKTQVPAVKGVPSRLRTAVEISGKTPDEWKVLSKDKKQMYQDQEAAEEVAYLSAEVAELRNLQYQQCMGWALLACNGLFIASSLVVSLLVLRIYDNRINLLVSTVVCGLITQLVSQQNDEAAKNKAAKKKKN
ncbi:translocon-associated protein subunit gamma [Diplonema papillatum]|nr:translocon-associated protein subunit gamma [Diplonema papillatum]